MKKIIKLILALLPICLMAQGHFQLVGPERSLDPNIEFSKCIYGWLDVAPEKTKETQVFRNSDGSIEIEMLIRGLTHSISFNPPKPTENQKNGKEIYLILDSERSGELTNIRIVFFYLKETEEKGKYDLIAKVKNLIFLAYQVVNPKPLAKLLSIGYFAQCNGVIKQPLIKTAFEEYNLEEIIDLFKKYYRINGNLDRRMHEDYPTPEPYICPRLDALTAIKFLENPQTADFLQKNLPLFYGQAIDKSSLFGPKLFLEATAKDVVIRKKNGSEVFLSKEIIEKIGSFLDPVYQIVASKLLLDDKIAALKALIPTEFAAEIE